jgi:hypothetical protein
MEGRCLECGTFLDEDDLEICSDCLEVCRDYDDNIFEPLDLEYALDPYSFDQDVYEEN